jgi:hypothetical protein
LKAEVLKAGKDVHIVVVNAISAATNVTNLTDVTKVPVFQDVQEVDAWTLHAVGKDDFLIYDKEGKLIAYMPISGEIDTVLQSDKGFQNVLAALLKATK